MTFRVGDVAAGMCWLVTALLVVKVTIGDDNGALRMWALLCGFGTCCLTGCLWLARKIEALRSECFEEGLRVGVEARDVLHLRDHERL